MRLPRPRAIHTTRPTHPHPRKRTRRTINRRTKPRSEITWNPTPQRGSDDATTSSPSADRHHRTSALRNTALPIHAGQEVSSRRQFGAIRLLASGRYQVRYRDRLTGELTPAPSTFATKKEANLYLSRVETEKERGTFIDPNNSKISLSRYAEKWLANHPALRPRTRENYDGNLRLHILPRLGQSKLDSSNQQPFENGILNSAPPRLRQQQLPVPIAYSNRSAPPQSLTKSSTATRAPSAVPQPQRAPSVQSPPSTKYGNSQTPSTPDTKRSYCSQPSPDYGSANSWR